MDNKFFGIAESGRTTTDGTGGDAIPSAKRATGFTREQPFYEYINQALFELKTDHIIGTAAQLALGQCTCKYQSSDQTLRDSSGTAVTFTDGDRVYIIGLDPLTADFDLSAYNRLRVTVDPSISLDNSSWDLVFGDESVLDIQIDNTSNITYGAGSGGYVNSGVMYLEKIGIMSRAVKELDVKGEIRASDGILFGTDTAAANALDDYEEGEFTARAEDSSGNTSTTKTGYYTKIGNVCHIVLDMFNISTVGLNAGDVFTINLLPFVSAAYSQKGFSVAVQEVAFSDGIIGDLAASSSAISFRSMSSASTGVTTKVSSLTSTLADFELNFSYQTA